MFRRTDAATVHVAAPLEPGSVTVAITGTQPVYRHGLAAVLEGAGFVVAEPDDVLAWSASRRDPAVIAMAEGAEDLERVAALREASDGLVLVILLCQDDPQAYQSALSAGADAAVHRDAALEEILSVFQAALSDQTLLPTAIARELADDGVTGDAPLEVSDEERELLRALASGDTVAQIGDALGFSDRETYRRLRRLYAGLGVTNRSEALVLAARARLI